ncbi:hypothetical protein GQ600_14182 [Phytophthora cactorum]|nr:hypothetical protein GQ600_14182 [Phytophthora cactorum]
MSRYEAEVKSDGAVYDCITIIVWTTKKPSEKHHGELDKHGGGGGSVCGAVHASVSLRAAPAE